MIKAEWTNADNLATQNTSSDAINLVEEAKRLWETIVSNLVKQMAKRAVEQIEKEKEQSNEID